MQRYFWNSTGTFSGTTTTLISLQMNIDIGDQRLPRVEDGYQIIEFFRLIATLDKELHSDSKTPFFDVAQLLDPTAEEVDMESFVQKDRFELLSLPAQRVCRWHVKFESVAKVIRDKLPDSNSPYRPLIALLQSGGRFRTEDIFVDVGAVSIPWVDWRKLAGLPQ